MRLAVPEHIQVGSVSIPMATAQLWVAEYTNIENVSAKTRTPTLRTTIMRALETIHCISPTRTFSRPRF